MKTPLDVVEPPLEKPMLRSRGQETCKYCSKQFCPDKNHPEHLCWENLASANQALATCNNYVASLRDVCLKLSIRLHQVPGSDGELLALADKVLGV